MAATKKQYTVDGGGLAGVRLLDENGAALTGRFPDEEAAVAALEAAKKAAGERKRAAKNDES